ncbi:MAG: hypothetical protein BJ554DRAFT_1523 [Olpidium bornovanus]|uniref:Succinate dehydrogenase assembly factor 3 n=1 Tax=Olpidium bornovanus TaxID=278681 RepID=A0A8H7ZS89_9FUNG|nr:MAG: hypothetical protein BJ554DRAFT_1523 [Olpidium bornovanus]
MPGKSVAPANIPRPQAPTAGAAVSGYVRKEFRDHRNVDDHATVGKFLTEWQKYLAVVLPPAPGAEDFGERLRERRKIDARLLDAASDQQLGQLWELRKAALRGDAEGEPALPPAPSAEAPRRES